MPTGLVTPPEHDSDRIQEEYDRKFAELTDQPDMQDLDRQADQSTDENSAPQVPPPTNEATKTESKTLDSSELQDKEGSGVPPEKNNEADTQTADAPKGLYKETPVNNVGWRGRFRRATKNKKVLLGVGCGALGGAIAVTSMFSLFSVFKGIHILKNIDSKTFARSNAAYDARSKAYTKAYFRLRLAELTDDVNAENPVFRARKISTGDPLRDWYHTMRLSKFEADLASKGIVIVNKTTNDPRFPQFKVLKVNGDEVLTGISPKDVKQGKIEDVINGYISSGEYDKKINNFFDSDATNYKQARKQINTIVKDNTHRVGWLTRRQRAKYFRQLTGQGSFRFFETKRDKVNKAVAERKAAVANKLVDATFKKGSNNGKILKCLFGTGACTSTTDPVDPENHATNSLTGDVVSSGPDESEQVTNDGQSAVTSVDKNGNPVVATTSDYGAAQAADEIANATNEATDGKVEELTTQAGEKIILTAGQEQVIKAVSSIVGGNPWTKGWSYAKRLANIRDNLPKIVLTITAARLAQQAAVYGTYLTASDQARSGELNMGEYGDLMNTLGDVTRTDGWQSVVDPNPNAASAAAVNNLTEAEYCKASPTEQANSLIHYFCDRAEQSNAAHLVDDFNNSPAGAIINPIADAVDAVKNNAFGKFFDSVLNLGDTVVSKALDPVVNTAMQATGTDAVMGKVMGTAMTSLTNWAGAGPQFDPSSPGAANFLVAGSAVMAESTTRFSGGVASTPETLGYSSKLAADLKAEERSEQSLFERYASLSNPESVASNMAFAALTTSSSRAATSLFGALSSPFSSLSKLFSGKALAATANSPVAAARWAGIKTFDIPIQCYNLEPDDQNYLNDAIGVATNDQALGAKAQAVVDKMKLTLDIETARNSETYGQLLYQTVGKTPDAEAIATAIYNCAIFDTTVMGSMGAQYGYTNDYGLSETPQGDQAVNSANANLYVIGDSLTQFMKEQGGLQEKLTAPGWNPTIDGVCGRSLSLDKNVLCGNQSGRLLSGLTLVGAQAPRQPGDANDQTAVSQTQAGIRQAGVVEIALGTNDAGDPNFESHVRSMVGKIRELKPSVLIYWTNLITTDGSADKYPPMNAVLTKLQQEGLITKVIDWATQAQAISAYKPGNIHPYKYEEMSQFIAQQIGVPAQGGGVNTSNLIKGDTTNITCGAGTDLGPTDGYDDGAKYRIRICDVQGAHVNSQVAVNIDKMFTAAKSAGLAMSGGGFRSMDGQIAVRKNNCGSSDYDIYQKPSSQCNPPAARPGYSNHQMGYAIDITCNGTIIPQFTNDNPCYLWLTQNAATYGFKNLPRSSPSFEAWHWSVDGK